MTDYTARLRERIAHLESRKRYFDAAECPQWFSETFVRESVERDLRATRELLRWAITTETMQ